MSDSNAKVYVFAVRYKNNPQFDRALFLYLNLGRNRVIKWKICRLTYNKAGADIDSKHPSFRGTADDDGNNCKLLKADKNTFATVQFTKPLSTMKPHDLADYTEGSAYTPIDLITIEPSEFFEAFISEMTATA